MYTVRRLLFLPQPFDSGFGPMLLFKIFDTSLFYLSINNAKIKTTKHTALNLFI